MSEPTSSTPMSLESTLEMLLFAAPQPVTLAQLATVLKISQKQVEAGLQELSRYYQNRGLRLQWHNKRVQLTTAPQAAEIIETFLGLEATSRLSHAALEALAIIAYQQPVSRPQIDAIRGVNSDGVMRGLLRNGLILEVGRAPGPGRPILYSTTPEFLQNFGLNSLAELPPLNLEEISASAGEIELLKE